MDKITVTVGSLLFPGIRSHFEADPGSTVLDLVRLAGIPERFDRLLRVWIDDTPIPAEWWARVRPKPGRIVAIGMAPGADLTGANGKDTLQLAIPSLLQFGIYAGGMALGLPGMAAGAASLLVGGVGGQWISQNLIHVPEPPTNPEFTTIRTARNQMRPYECIPRVYGQIRYAPPLAAMPVTSVEGQDQYVRLLLCPGYGPLKITGFRIGDYEITGARAQKVDIERHTLWNDSLDDLTLFTRDVYEPPPIEKQLDYAPDWNDLDVASVQTQTDSRVVTVVTPTDATEIALDFLWPEGLYEENNKETDSYPVELAVRYRPKGATGANSWMYYAGASSTYTPSSITDTDFYNRLVNLNDALDDVTANLNAVAVGSRYVSDALFALFVPKLNDADAVLADNIAQGILSTPEETAASAARTKIAALQVLANTVTVVEDISAVATDFNDNLSSLIFVLDTIDGIHRVWQYSRNNEGPDVRTLPAWQRTVVYLLGLDWVVPTGGPGSFVVRTEGGSRAPLWKSISWKVPKGQYEVQVRRATKNKYKDDKIHSRVVLFTWRTVQDDSAVSQWVKDNLALVAMKIKATSDWNNQIDQVSMLCESPLYWHNGASWQGPALEDDDGNSVSRNPAWQFCDILRGSAGRDPVTDDDDLDLTQIRAFADYCNDNGYTCDMIFDRRVSQEEAMQTVCRCGKGWPTKTAEGKYSVIIDQEQTTARALITPRNSRGLVGFKQMEERPHALRVKFINADADYQEDEAYVYADGYGNGLTEPTVIEDVRFDGITSTTLVKHFGRYFLACSTLRPETWQFEMDFENLVFERGDMVRLQHWTPLFGKGAARITGLEAVGTRTFLTLDEHPSAWEWTPRTANAIRVRTAGNVLIYGEVNYSAGVDADRMYIDEPYPSGWAGVAVGDLLAIGALTLETTDCIVKAIQPTGDLSARITLIEHAPDVHDADDDIAEYDSRITLPYNPDMARPPRPAVISIEVGDSATTRLTDGTMAARVLIGINLPRGNTAAERAAARDVIGIEVQYQLVGAERWQVMPTFTRDLQNVFVDPVEKGKAYNVRVRSMTRTGVPSLWFSQFGLTIMGKQTRPPDVTGLRYENGVLYWNAFAAPDFLGYEVRHIYGSGASWRDATPLHDGAIVSASCDVRHLEGGDRVFLVKALDTSGNYSRHAATLNIDLGDLRDGVGWAAYDFINPYGSEEAELTNMTLLSGGIIAADAGSRDGLYDGPGRPFYRAAGEPFYQTAYPACEVRFTIPAQIYSTFAAPRISVATTITGADWRLEWRCRDVYNWPEDTDDNAWPDDLDADFWPEEMEWRPFRGRVENARYARVGETVNYEFRIVIYPSNTQCEITRLFAYEDLKRIEEFHTNFEIGATGEYLDYDSPEWSETTFGDQYTRYWSKVLIRIRPESAPYDQVHHVDVLDLNPYENPGSQVNLGPQVMAYDAGGNPVQAKIDYTLIGG